MKKAKKASKKSNFQQVLTKKGMRAMCFISEKSKKAVMGPMLYRRKIRNYTFFQFFARKS